MTKTFVVAAVVALLGVPAWAHVTVWPQQSRVGANERYTVRVPTEGQVPTRSVEIEIPADVTVTGILAPAGYAYEAIREDGRIARIIWKQELKPGEIGEFVFFARNPKKATIAWRAHQRFIDGTSTDWTGPPGDERPAAVVRLVP